MENNEDNRQMTQIVEAIYRIKKLDDDYSTGSPSAMEGFQNCQKEVIQILESLLPKEKEQWVQAYVIGWNDSHSAFEDGFQVPEAEDRFNETFKTQ